MELMARFIERPEADVGEALRDAARILVLLKWGADATLLRSTEHAGHTQIAALLRRPNEPCRDPTDP